MQTSGVTAVIDQLNETGVARGDAGEAVCIKQFAISRQVGEYLEAAVRQVAADTVVEVGCASGLSTLYLGRGVLSSKSLRPPVLHVMDPRQHTHWKNIGRAALERAGLAEVVHFYEESAHVVLPRLAEQGVSIQLAFIDGWHMLDYVMLEAFYCDLLLEEGGLLALHDLWMPGVQHCASFWHANRAYAAVRVGHDGAFQTGPVDGAPVAPSLRQGSAYFVREIAPHVQHGVLLLRKVSGDRRRWDEFRDFLL